MKQRNRTVILVLAAVLVSFSALMSPAAQPVEMRFSAYYPESYPVYKEGFNRWEAMVAKESAGRIVFKNYLNGVLHTAKQGFRSAMTGVCDLTHAYPSYQPASFQLSTLNDLPFAISTTHGGVLAMETLYPKYFKKEYEKMGVLLGCWVTTSEYNLISKKPIRTLADLKGMKIRSYGGLCSDTLALLGASPVMVQSAESYTSFQNGVVDGVLYPDSSMVSYRLFEIGKYHTRIALSHMGVPYAMNPAFWKTLPADLKPFMYDKLRQASQMASMAYEIDDEQAREVLQQNGVEFIELPESERAKFTEAVQPLWDKFIEENEKKGLPARQLVKELKALDAAYAAMTPEEVFENVTRNPVKGIIDF